MDLSKSTIYDRHDARHLALRQTRYPTRLINRNTKTTNEGYGRKEEGRGNSNLDSGVNRSSQEGGDHSTEGIAFNLSQIRGPINPSSVGSLDFQPDLTIVSSQPQLNVRQNTTTSSSIDEQDTKGFLLQDLTPQTIALGACVATFGFALGRAFIRPSTSATGTGATTTTKAMGTTRSPVNSGGGFSSSSTTNKTTTTATTPVRPPPPPAATHRAVGGRLAFGGLPMSSPSPSSSFVQSRSQPSSSVLPQFKLIVPDSRGARNLKAVLTIVRMIKR
jgi:hypothetical protein